MHAFNFLLVVAHSTPFSLRFLPGIPRMTRRLPLFFVFTHRSGFWGWRFLAAWSSVFRGGVALPTLFLLADRLPAALLARPMFFAVSRLVRDWDYHLLRGVLVCAFRRRFVQISPLKQGQTPFSTPNIPNDHCQNGNVINLPVSVMIYGSVFMISVCSFWATGRVLIIVCAHISISTTRGVSYAPIREHTSGKAP